MNCNSRLLAEFALEPFTPLEGELREGLGAIAVRHFEGSEKSAVHLKLAHYPKISRMCRSAGPEEGRTC
jgi:hypothetical protein